MDFFSNLNFTRIVILLSLIGSAVLGYLVREGQTKLAELEQQVETGAPLLVNQIQTDAVKLDQLIKQASRDGFIQMGNPQTYIRTIAEYDEDGKRVAIGDVKITTGKRNVAADVIDRTYKIDPSDKERDYALANISNFMYRMEEESRQVKVTNLKIEQVKRPPVDQPLPKRNWTFSVTVTSREANEG